MASQKAEVGLSHADTEGVYKLNKGSYDIFFFPETSTEPAKLRVAMKIDDAKVPPTGSLPGDPDAFAVFNGDERRDDFVFFASKTQMTLLEPRSSGRRKEFRIEFEVPGAVLTVKKPLHQSSGRLEK